MCVHCTSPVAAVVSPVLPSSRKAARPGRELELHVAPAASLSRRAVPVPKARPDTSEGSLSLCLNAISLTLPRRLSLSGSPSHRSCGPCRALHSRTRGASLPAGCSLPEHGSSSRLCREVPVQSRVWKCRRDTTMLWMLGASGH